eukprot:3535095-Karenia_brevis.AAC.1
MQHAKKDSELHCPCGEKDKARSHPPIPAAPTSLVRSHLGGTDQPGAPLPVVGPSPCGCP